MSVYYMMNKPAGLLTAMRDDRRPTVAEVLPREYRETLFPVGRLDKDTEGFLLFTDDGILAHRLMDPASGKTKTYFFYAIGFLDEEKCRRLEAGVPLDGETLSRPARIRVEKTTTLGEISGILAEPERRASRSHEKFPIVGGTLTVTEGKKHQVKRMLKAVGCHVVYLRRDAIGSLPLDKTLAPGEGRLLTPAEVAHLTVPAEL